MLSLFESDVISATDIFNLLVTNCLLPGQTFHVTVGNAANLTRFLFFHSFLSRHDYDNNMAQEVIQVILPFFYQVLVGLVCKTHSK